MLVKNFSFEKIVICVVNLSAKLYQFRAVEMIVKRVKIHDLTNRRPNRSNLKPSKKFNNMEGEKLTESR